MLMVDFSARLLPKPVAWLRYCMVMMLMIVSSAYTSDISLLKLCSHYSSIIAELKSNYNNILEISNERILFPD